MSNAPEAPPIYRAVPLPAGAAAGAAAVAAAKDGADPATLFWVDGAARAQCAIVLAPQSPLRETAQMALVGMTALGDALGAILPPMTVVGYRLPDSVLLNDARLGTIETIIPGNCTAEAVPDWLVVAVDIGVTRFAEGSAEAADLSVTTFEDEGCMEISTGETTGAFARYLLAWIDRWQKDGFTPVRTNWENRGPSIGQEIELELGGQIYAGRFAGLSSDAEIMIDGDEGVERIGAIELLHRWRG